MTNSQKEKIIDKYVARYGKLPPIPMIKSAGYYDPQYIKMLIWALRTGNEVTIEIINKFFPSDPDVDY